MSTISVFPDETNAATRMYRATSGDREAVGLTVGDAVNGLADQNGSFQETTLVIVQPMKPDRFFTADQISRLQKLMTKWRAALNQGAALPADEQSELNGLVQAELEGMIERTKSLGQMKK